MLTQQKGENAELLRFYQILGRALKSFGMRVESSFTPHITMFYGEEAPGTPVERIRWLVEEFEFICAHNGHSKYEPLRRWKLRGNIFPAGIQPAKPNLAQIELGLGV